MKLFIIVGEASGDLHGSNLIKNLLALNPKIEIEFWGGDKMAHAARKQPLKHINDLAFMGFLEVAKHLSDIKKNFELCIKQIAAFQPNAVVMIDYPGFNLRISSFTKKLGIKNLYYISPKVWAWKKKRVQIIKKNIDKLYSILPFEVDFFKSYNYEIEYVGNPLMDALEDFIAQQNTTRSQKHIVLMPGSRIQEIQRMLPVMTQVADKYPARNFVIAGAPGFNPKFYDELMGAKKYPVLFDQAYTLLWNAEAALVTSGTATLETALLNVPQVVCYKANYLSYIAAKNLVKIKFISLVNLIMQRKVVTELIQNEFNVHQLIEELELILIGGSQRERTLADYEILKQKVGTGGASQRVAKSIIQFLSENE